MPTTLKIDFVSDVSCPWCIIGLKALEQAADRLKGEVALDLHFQPFELNPQMGSQGQDVGEHLQEKYGATPEQSQKNREAIAARGAELGFTFAMDKRSRIYNTFDAHRLLHWAEEKGVQPQLKHALFKAYFTDGQDPSNHEVLVRVAGEVGLNADEARELLASDRFAQEVREREQFYLQNGILRAGHHRQRTPPDSGRAAGRGVRAGAAADCGTRLNATYLIATQDDSIGTTGQYDQKWGLSPILGAAQPPWWPRGEVTCAAEWPWRGPPALR